MQIKNILILFISLICLPSKSNCQAITYTETIIHSLCSSSNNGSIELTITSTNPPYNFQWSTGGSGNKVENLAPGTYTVTITDNLSNSTSASFVITELECDIHPELVFTPNGDGYADAWYIGKINEFPESLVIVYNRMGQKVFEQKGQYEPWDGRDLLGTPVPDGTYYYIVYANKKNKKPDAKGSVTIIR